MVPPNRSAERRRKRNTLVAPLISFINLRVPLWVVVLVIFTLARFNHLTTSTILGDVVRDRGILSEPIRVFLGKSAEPCSSYQLDIINRHLPDLWKWCSAAKHPWRNKCPITILTGCPEASWVEQYFQEVFSEEEFHAVNVGCNKGFDAVNILRMGSNNASISRSSWSGAMPKDLAPGVCGQESEKSQYEITQAKQSRKARVLCVEPLPVNFIALEKAAQTTRFDGLSVLQYALNNEEPGSVFFPKPAATNENTTSHTDVGAEKKGIADCFSHKPWRRKEIEKSCQEVRSTRLDEMMQLEGFSSKRIDFMLIDVEGWDFEVLKGGNETLKRTSYLEFEYNWRGKYWDTQTSKPLLLAIIMLDDLGFTCYWAGKHKLWRITGCWLKHYEGLFWSNVACANRNLVPVLVHRMEKVFEDTIAQEKQPE